MNELETECVDKKLSIRQLERVKKIWGILSTQMLKQQNARFVNTMGVSQNNRSGGFVPAYYDMTSGVSVESRFANGHSAPVHVLDGLPKEWVAMRDLSGRVAKTRPGVIAGFLRDGRFYTREEAVYAMSH